MEVKNKVQYIDIDKLELLENNPRQINKENFDKLKKSIRDNKDYFEARPLIVSNRTGKNIIIAGNQRYKASKELNLKQVPCVILKDLTEDKEKEITVRDNVELGDWNYDLLSSDWEVEDLEEWGVEVPVIENEEEKENEKEINTQEYKEKFIIIIDCDNELEQEQIYYKLQQQNIKCRIQSL